MRDARANGKRQEGHGRCTVSSGDKWGRRRGTGSHHGEARELAAFGGLASRSRRSGWSSGIASVHDEAWLGRGGFAAPPRGLPRGLPKGEGGRARSGVRGGVSKACHALRNGLLRGGGRSGVSAGGASAAAPSSPAGAAGVDGAGVEVGLAPPPLNCSATFCQKFMCEVCTANQKPMWCEWIPSTACRMKAASGPGRRRSSTCGKACLAKKRTRKSQMVRPGSAGSFGSNLRLISSSATLIRSCCLPASACPLWPMKRSLTKNSTSRSVMRRTCSKYGSEESIACTPAGLPSRSADSVEFIDSCSSAVCRCEGGGSAPCACLHARRRWISPHLPRPRQD
mmetsp:Transcript_5621/g.16325  ORF Transcript_5621/g.16325 Transcript_5621/m.16325 type:complete len:339 (-) Transcript_5621:254-1270(-)